MPCGSRRSAARTSTAAGTSGGGTCSPGDRPHPLQRVALPDEGPDPAPRHVDDHPAHVGQRLVGGPHPVPSPPRGGQGVGREVVGAVRVAQQQVGQPRELAVVPLEEPVELAAGGIRRALP
ncbi:hypothetical protein LUX39_32970 [Actinomadura madurae]|nr:hypothetical protein [Actinomadura madurae]MCQ0018006.1 hypothetical protein [Actinomadura madurae]